MPVPSLQTFPSGSKLIGATLKLCSDNDHKPSDCSRMNDPPPHPEHTDTGQCWGERWEEGRREKWSELVWKGDRRMEEMREHRERKLILCFQRRCTDNTICLKQLFNGLYKNLIHSIFLKPHEHNLSVVPHMFSWKCMALLYTTTHLFMMVKNNRSHYIVFSSSIKSEFNHNLNAEDGSTSLSL